MMFFGLLVLALLTSIFPVSEFTNADGLERNTSDELLTFPSSIIAGQNQRWDKRNGREI
jgi:hypothetical protein